MGESITFPEEKIREVVTVIRAGLKVAKVSRETKQQLEKQCKELIDYIEQ
jgi:hypothetical protein